MSYLVFHELFLELSLEELATYELVFHELSLELALPMS